MNINKYYGFIYITKNKVNGRKYIGKKAYDKGDRWKSYLGSGIALKNAISKYGREKFTKKIIDNAITPEELCNKEIYWIKQYNAVESDKFYNISNGGDGYDYFSKMSLETSNNVYNINTKTAYRNATLAGYYCEEKDNTITNKCKAFKKYNGNNEIRKGAKWCYTKDMYLTYDGIKIKDKKPVVHMGTGIIYECVSHANNSLPFKVNDSRSVLSISVYKKWIKINKDISNRVMYLSDYLKIYEKTGENYKNFRMMI